MNKSYSAIAHLCKEMIIKNGSIFTPEKITKIVFELVKPFFNNSTIVGELGAGYGSFINTFNNKVRLFGTEYDETSYKFLKQEFPNVKFYHENSLLHVSRQKYNLKPDDNLIIIGNPPYNNFSSIYKKGEKGVLVADDDLMSRDYGTSFLKAYNKLGANYVCVLHPLAYLTKKSNFNQLKLFKDNYKLIKGIIFSSKEFETISKSNAQFPVVIALYEKNNKGMDYNYIQNFNFDILDIKQKFCLNKFSFIDGHINKYPSKNSKCKIQFYTIRDINALNRNRAFIKGPIPNGIDVNIDNLYQYAWLFYFKNNIKLLNNLYIFGNCTPFYSKNIEQDDVKNELVWYAWNKEKLIQQNFSSETISKKYGKDPKSCKNIEQIFNKLNIYK